MVDASKMEIHVAVDPGTHRALNEYSADIGLSRNAIIAILLDKLVAGDAYMHGVIISKKALNRANTVTFRSMDVLSIYELLDEANPLNDK